MSDELSLRYHNKEVFKFVLGNTDIREPLHSYQLQWMTHWTQASSSSSLQCQKHCTVNAASYTCEGKNAWIHDLGKQDPKSYVLQSAEAQGGGNGRFRNINNSTVRNDLYPFGSETYEKLYEHKLPSSSTNWENFASYHFQNSKSPSSEWMHFPMFDTNRKIETIIAPKKRIGSNTMAAKMNDRRLPVSSLSLDPHLMEFASEGIQHQNQQQNLTQNDNKVSPCQSIEGLSPHNCHRSNMTSSMQNDEEHDHFCSGLAFKEHFANANLTYLKHELCKDGSSSCPDIPRPSLAEECNKEIDNVFGRNKTTLGLSKSNIMSNCSTPQESFNTSQYLMIRNKVTDLCHKDKIVGGSTVSANAKETAFFEKFSLPTMLDQHGHREENFHTMVSPTNSKEGIGDIDTQFMEKENESLVKTDTMHVDVPRSPEVGSSSESQKDVARPILKISKIADTDTSRAESGGVLSRKPSNPPTEITQRHSEPSSKWVKRLRPNPLDPMPLGAKRFKMGDTSSSGEMQNLLARVVNYNRSISDLPECQQLDETTFFPKNGECLPRDSTKVIPWIRRWCRSSQETASSTPVLCEPENSKVPPEKFEAKQFPSLAAMALMGKQVTNFRPCEFRRRGSTIVWNI